LLIFLICLISVQTIKAQNKSAYTWIVGNNASYGVFDGTNSKPQTGSLYQTTSPNFPYAFTGGHSNICDSATGKLLFLCNGMQLHDTTGNIIENGDSLVPSKIYLHDVYPNSGYTQSSLILPKGNNGEYYVFIPTMSDNAYDSCIAGTTKCPFDLFYYNVVDMNANGGLGKVTIKNKLLLQNHKMNKVMMQACRHANGVDWWLLKQGEYDKNEIIRFLVTKDSIFGPYYQTFAQPQYGFYDLTGQMAFSKDGKKFASVHGQESKLFMADFDRCSGELSNPKVFNIPIDSTSWAYADSIGYKDSLSGGGGFSPNGQFFYVSKEFNLYQFEYGLSDSTQAWYNLKRGTDTTWNAFEFYGKLGLGHDNRMYIGKVGGGFKQFSVIDYPDLKGSACGFCRKCFRVDNALGGLNSPPNVPDFNLGADVSLLPCWPLSNEELIMKSEEWVVYPNPSNTTLTIKNKKGKKKELYNSVGQMIYSTTKEVIDVSGFSKVIYFIKCEGEVKKVVVE
jgi:hypothetical protein